MDLNLSHKSDLKINKVKIATDLEDAPWNNFVKAFKVQIVHCEILTSIIVEEFS